MKRVFLAALGLGIILQALTAGAAGQAETVIADELNRLNIQTAGEPTQSKETLPEDLTAGPTWGVVLPSCRAAGYELEDFAGEDVVLTIFPITEPGGPAGKLTATVVTSGDEIACVYKENAALIPGVYPADTSFNDPSEEAPDVKKNE